MQKFLFLCILLCFVYKPLFFSGFSSVLRLASVAGIRIGSVDVARLASIASIFTVFVICIFRLMENDPAFSVDRLWRQVKTFPHKFIMGSRKIDMFRMIDELYNYRKQGDNRHYIDLNL